MVCCSPLPRVDIERRYRKYAAQFVSAYERKTILTLSASSLMTRFGKQEKTGSIAVNRTCKKWRYRHVEHCLDWVNTIPPHIPAVYVCTVPTDHSILARQRHRECSTYRQVLAKAVVTENLAVWTNVARYVTNARSV